MNNCGGRFHSEMAKFRFLNEMIKVLSPKVSDGGYRVFQDKKCSSALSKAVGSSGHAPLLWGRPGPACLKPSWHHTHQFPFLVDPAHIYH